MYHNVTRGTVFVLFMIKESELLWTTCFETKFSADTWVFLNPEILIMYLKLPVTRLYFEGNFSHHIISCLNILTYIAKR